MKIVVFGPTGMVGTVPTRDIARARHFYGEILGLPRNPDTP
jgi:hypothetical protein